MRAVTQKSALYVGTISHTRRSPVRHSFQYPLFFAYVDLDELGVLDRVHPLFSVEARNLISFHREDYLRDETNRALPLVDAVRARVARSLGQSPRGPVRVLTNLRMLGHCFNPVTFYYCFDERERLQAIVAEITNTPWDERHAYVLPFGETPEDPSAATRSFQFEKAFHVSPFLPMNRGYVWRMSEPGDSLFTHMDVTEGETPQFSATLHMQRQPFSRTALTAALTRFPAMSLQVLVRIYAQAARLRWKGAPFFTHPASAH